MIVAVETPRRGVSTVQYNTKIKMPEKFKNKYTIKSSRLSNYDYSQNGMYFVTICTKDKEYFLGDVKNGEMVLNDVGKIIQDEWLKTPIIRNNVILDEWVIMPNHLHGIVEIRNNENNNFIVETPRRGVSTTTITMPNNKPKRGGYNPNWKPNSLGSIINQFKSVCTKRVWKSGSYTFAWQPRYYDQIIRNEISLNKIREYIQINPRMWERDRNKTENIFM